MSAPTRETLPCSPCPHKGACCRKGVDLSDDEAMQLVFKFGKEAIRRGRIHWRTAMKNDTCFFHDRETGLCSIYKSKLYPAVCAGYPWTDGFVGGPYAGDKQECPEFVK